MRMKKILSLAACMLFCNEAYSNDRGNSYLKIQASGNIPNNITHKNIEYKGDMSFGGSLGIGYSAVENINIELGLDCIYNNKYEYKIKSAQVESQLNNIISPKLMIYYDYKPSDNMGVYLGFGGGTSFISTTMTSHIKKNLETISTVFLTGEAGISFSMNKTIFDLGYSIGFHGKHYDFEIIIHSAKIGVRYFF
jgi:outer membrane protein W